MSGSRGRPGEEGAPGSAGPPGPSGAPGPPGGFFASALGNSFPYPQQTEKGPLYGYQYGYYYRYYKSRLRSSEGRASILPKDLNVFAYADELELRMDAVVKPDGTKDFPAKTCRDIQMCFPDAKTGRAILAFFFRIPNQYTNFHRDSSKIGNCLRANSAHGQIQKVLGDTSVD